MKKILLLMLCMLFLVGTVSALLFDNGLKYQENDLKVVAENGYWFGIGEWFGLNTELGTATLKSHTSINQILNVQYGGEFVVMYYDFEGWGINENGLGDVIFTNQRTGKIIERNYTYVEWKEVEVPNLVDVCDVSGNKYTNCRYENQGTKLVYKWVELKNRNIKNARIGIKTYVEQGDFLDGVWTIEGKKVKKHSEWTADLNPFLNRWYDFEDLTENITGDDLTNYGSVVFSKALIGNGADSSPAPNTAKTLNVTSNWDIDGNITSFSIWVNSTGAGVGDDGIMGSCSDNTDVCYSIAYANNNVRWHRIKPGIADTFINFAFTLFENATLNHIVGTYDGTNIYLFIDGTWRETLGATGNGGSAVTNRSGFFKDMFWQSANYSGLGDLAGVFNVNLTQAQITQLFNDQAGIMMYENDFAGSPTITLDSPANNTNFTVSSVVFNATIFDATNITNVTLYLNDVSNETNSTAGLNNTLWTFNVVGLADGDTFWTMESCNFLGGCGNASQRLFSIDTIDPVLTVANLTNLTTTTLPVNSTWTYSASDSNIDLCYYNTTEDSTYQFITCNSTITDTEWTTEGDKTVQYCANDTVGHETCNTSLLTVFLYTDFHEVVPTTIGEGGTVGFTLYVNMTDTPHTIANLTFNNTEYVPTITTAQNYTLFQSNIVIPDGWGTSAGNNLTANWTYNITGVVNVTTTNDFIDVFSVEIDDCSTFGVTILNYTLNDEEDKAFMDSGQLIEYDLNISNPLNLSQSWQFSASKPNLNTTQVCVPVGLLNNSFYTLDTTTKYEATGHVVEFNYIDNYNLSTTEQQNISLYSLNSSDSTSFLIIYQDENYLPIENAIIDLQRFYVGEGISLSVEHGKTDDNGQTVLHFVTEEVQYKTIVNVDGETVFTSPDFLALCQETPCQINLQKQDDVSALIDYETFGNINYGLTLNLTSRDVDLTFNTRDGSSSTLLLNVTQWDAYLNTSVCSDTVTSSSGSLTCNVPLTARNMTYYVLLTENGNLVTQSSFGLNANAFDNFGYTGIILVGLLFLTLVLMAVPSGAIATLVFGALGLVFATMLTLFSGGALIGGGSALMWLIIAIVIVIIKISNRRQG